MSDELFTLQQVQADKYNDYVLHARTDDGEYVYRRVMTDDQIYRASMEDWVSAVALLWDAINKPVDEKSLNTYCRLLKGIPLELLEIGINYAIRNNTYKTVPAVGLVFEGIRNELKSLNLRPNIPFDDAVEAWLSAKYKAITYFVSK